MKTSSKEEEKSSSLTVNKKDGNFFEKKGIFTPK